MKFLVSIHVSSVIDADTEEDAREIAEGVANAISAVTDLPYPVIDLEIE